MKKYIIFRNKKIWIKGAIHYLNMTNKSLEISKIFSKEIIEIKENKLLNILRILLM